MEFGVYTKYVIHPDSRIIPHWFLPNVTVSQRQIRDLKFPYHTGSYPTWYFGDLKKRTKFPYHTGSYPTVIKDFNDTVKK